MRYKIEFTKPASLPANNQHLVNGFIHNLLGRNNQYHDNASNYNISSLLGGKLDMGTKTLTFKNTNPFIIISSIDAEFMSKIVMGVLQKPSLTHDCVFTDITLLSEDFKDGVNHYLTLSPILLKEVRTEMVKGKEVKRDYFNTIRDTDFSEKLKVQTIRKLKAINQFLDLSKFDLVVLDKPINKVRVIKVREVYNYASVCNVDITCSKEISEILFNVGLGNSTGSGFGTIYKTFDQYKF